MPTPESAKAFERLLAARNRLAEITKELNAIHAVPSRSMSDAARYKELKAQWEEAFHEFEDASQAFKSGLQGFKDMMDSHEMLL